MNASALPPLQLQRRLLAAATLAALVNFYAFYPGLYHHDA